MLALDKIGAKHDTEIARCGWSIANYNMRVRMKAHSLPLWPVRIPISISIALYRRLPQIIKNLYWK